MLSSYPRLHINTRLRYYSSTSSKFYTCLLTQHRISSRILSWYVVVSVFKKCRTDWPNFRIFDPNLKFWHILNYDTHENGLFWVELKSSHTMYWNVVFYLSWVNELSLSLISNMCRFPRHSFLASFPQEYIPTSSFYFTIFLPFHFSTHLIQWSTFLYINFTSKSITKSFQICLLLILRILILLYAYSYVCLARFHLYVIS